MDNIITIEQTFIQTDCDTCLRNKENWTIRDMEEYTYILLTHRT